MRELLVLAPLWLLAALWQVGFSSLPRFLHADLGLLIGLCGVAFLSCEKGLLFLFLLGFQADLLGSGHLGLLTFGYLLAAGLAMSIERELHAAGWRAVALASIAGTFVVHGLYFCVSAFSSFSVGWLTGGRMWLELTLAAAVWAFPLAWLLRKIWAWTRLLSPEVLQAEAQRQEQLQGRMRVKRA
jgi:hypothetical protein